MKAGIAIVVMITMVVLIQNWLFKARAKKIYLDLKKRLKGCRDLVIDKNDLMGKYGTVT